MGVNMNKIHILLICLFLSSCAVAPRVDFSNHISIKSAIVETVDEYRGTKTVEAPTSASDNPIGTFFGGTIVLPGGNAKKLSARLENEKIIAIYIELRDSYQGDWRFYSSATDINQKSMNFIKVDRNVGNCSQGCNLTEEIKIPIDLDYLRDNVDSGIDIQVYGQKGGTKIILSPKYVRAFYEYLRDY
jgi:hypothetical protein